MAKTCSNFNAVLTAFDMPENRILLARARCKMWSCPYCAEVNRKQWRLRIYTAAETLGPDWCFFTLTGHSRAKTPESALKNIKSNWDRLLKRMRRKWGKFAYVRVYEQGEKNGRWHVHGIANFNFDESDMRIRVSYVKEKRIETPYSFALQTMARKCSLGYYTHAENMKHGPAAAGKYITKYMTKALESMPKNIRRIQTSQGFPRIPEGEESPLLQWGIKDHINATDIENAIGLGLHYYDIQLDHIVTLDDTDICPIYPPELSPSSE